MAKKKVLNILEKVFYANDKKCSLANLDLVLYTNHETFIFLIRKYTLKDFAHIWKLFQEYFAHIWKLFQEWGTFDDDL